MKRFQIYVTIFREVKSSHSFCIGTNAKLQLSVAQLFWTLSIANQKIQSYLQFALISEEGPMRLSFTLKVPYMALAAQNFTVNENQALPH